jgi:hypothetical protein
MELLTSYESPSPLMAWGKEGINWREGEGERGREREREFHPYMY